MTDENNSSSDRDDDNTPSGSPALPPPLPSAEQVAVQLKAWQQYQSGVAAVVRDATVMIEDRRIRADYDRFKDEPFADQCRRACVIAEWHHEVCAPGWPYHCLLFDRTDRQCDWSNWQHHNCSRLDCDAHPDGMYRLQGTDFLLCADHYAEYDAADGDSDTAAGGFCDALVDEMRAQLDTCKRQQHKVQEARKREALAKSKELDDLLSSM